MDLKETGVEAELRARTGFKKLSEVFLFFFFFPVCNVRIMLLVNWTEATSRSSHYGPLW